jgi:glutamate carboxypeptidase
LPEILKQLEILVNIDSGSRDKAGVDQVGQVVAQALRQCGFDVESEHQELCGNRISGIRRYGGRGRLLILGHADTVWPQGTAAEWPFSVQDGLATGPGVGDMKGCVVMALNVLAELDHVGFSDLESIRFLLVPDEEIGSPQSRSWIEEAAQESDWAIVLEPARPGGGLVTARGALGHYFVTARGVTAHCGVNYHDGASAVRELARKVAPLEALSDPDRGIVVNVGSFHGGVAKQVVPAEARMELDIRARTPDDVAWLLERVNVIVQEVHDPRITVEMTGNMTRPAFTRERNLGLLEVAMRFGHALGLPLFEVPPTAGGSDANFPASLGIPTLDGVGPICRDICSRREVMEVDSLPDRGAMLFALIKNLPEIETV